MIDNYLNIEVVEPLEHNTSRSVLLTWGEEFYEFESRKELDKFIHKLNSAGNKAFK